MIDFLLSLLPLWLRPRQIMAMRERSSLWRATRAAHLLRQPECQACTRRIHLQVHHIVPVSIDPSKENDPENLMTLCITCHIVFGHFFNFTCYNTDVKHLVMMYRRAMAVKKKCPKK